MRLPALRTAAVAAALLLSASSASAQTSFSHTFTIGNTGGNGVAFLPFTVTSAGSFRMSTGGPTIDPYLYLFAGTPGSLGAALAVDDDGCSFAECGPAGAWWNSVFELALNPGNYTLAGSACCGSESNMRNGTVTGFWIAGGETTAPLTLRVNSVDGVAVSGMNTVPEPGTYALLATGLAGIGFVARRRRTA